jgi:hypothetical protein
MGLATRALAIVTAFALLALSARPAAASHILTPLGGPIWSESFVGETAFPMTPEVDTLGLGSGVDHAEGEPGFTSGIAFTGTALTVSVESSPFGDPNFPPVLENNVRGIGIDGVSLGPTQDVGLRGKYESFSGTRLGPNARFEAIVAFATPGTTIAGPLLQDFSDTSAGDMFLSLTESGGGLALLQLTAAEKAAVTSGLEFHIDLAIDRATNIASTSFLIDPGGSAFHRDTSLALTALGTQTITGFGQFAGTGNVSFSPSVDYGAGDTLVIDFIDPDLFVVPEPSAALLLALGLAGIAAMRRRQAKT